MKEYHTGTIRVGFLVNILGSITILSYVADRNAPISKDTN